jgi:uncharacterized membrane protein YheB (UPF0754 family)
MDTALALLPWLLPPVLGALIGYITNRIAIQMLFRPRASKHILRVHIPLTPGIIPKSRDELALNIGQLVARELLSPDTIRAQLDNMELRASLKQWIQQQRQALMQAPLSFPGAGGQKLLADLMPSMAEALHRVLRQPTLRNEMIKVGSDVVQNFAANQNVVARTAINISGIDRVVADRVPAIVDTIIAALESSATPDRIMELTDEWLQTGATKNLNDFVTLSKTTEDSVDEHLTERLIAFLGIQIPALSGILNIEQLVAEKIKTFDDAQVERMILDVTGQHLKWINYFGAGLGALIGLSQVVLHVLM